MTKHTGLDNSTLLLPQEHNIFSYYFKKKPPQWVKYFDFEYLGDYEEFDEDAFTKVYQEYRKWISGITEDHESLLWRMEDFITEDGYNKFKDNQLDPDDNYIWSVLDNIPNVESIHLISPVWYMSSISYEAKLVPWYDIWMIGLNATEFTPAKILGTLDKEGDLKTMAIEEVNSDLEYQFLEYQTKVTQAFEGLIKLSDLELPN